MIVNAKQLLPRLLLINEPVGFQQLEHRFRSQRGLLQGAANAPASILRAVAHIPRARAAQLDGNAFRGNIAGQVPTCLVLPRVGEGMQEQAVQQRMHVVMHGRFMRCGKASQHMVGVEVESLRISARQRGDRVRGGNERQQISRRRKERVQDQQPVFRKPQHLNSQLLTFTKLCVHLASFACWGREQGTEVFSRRPFAFPSVSREHTSVPCSHAFL